MARLSLLALAALVVVAGCGAPAASEETPRSDGTPVAAPPADATPRPTPTTTESTPGADYDTTTVRIVDEDGTTLATVEAWVADSWPKRYTGLSDTTALDTGEGMLFVHGSEGRHAYVMREMDFPLDMVFVAENGTITTIHHAPLPPEDESGSDLRQYAGLSKYVLEVPMGYTNETGIAAGDRVVIEGRTD
jgi:uncharacterized membrane protein (UPF0127 family)